MKKILMMFTLAVTSLGFANASNMASANPVLDAYVVVATALANDDLAAAKKAAAALAETAKSENQPALAEHAIEVVSSNSLDAARERFKATSVEAVKLAEGKAGYYVFTCPMAKAEWVQKVKDVQNPYMGKEMPGCGSIKAGTSASMKMGSCCG